MSLLSVNQCEREFLTFLQWEATIRPEDLQAVEVHSELLGVVLIFASRPLIFLFVLSVRSTFNSAASFTSWPLPK